jgi:hypothetical protein
MSQRLFDDVIRSIPLKKGEVWRNNQGFITLLWVDQKDVFFQSWSDHKVNKCSRVNLFHEYELVSPKEYLPFDYVLFP